MMLVLAAFLEMLSLLKTKGVDVLWFSGMIGTAALATCPFWWQFLEITPTPETPDGLQMLLLMSLILMAIFVEQMFQRASEMALLRIGGTALSVLYLGVGGALILIIRMTYGVPMLVVFLAAAKFTDMGAYLVGSLLGRHKLVPGISPGKSWEGLFGGLASGAIGSAAAVLILRQIPTTLQPNLSILQAALFGLIVGAAGQLSDLAESLLKRSAHVKDSGAVLPEFGGVLDIIDSLVFASPIAIILLSLMG
jgi:phosphatidate cytidylyltransferase